MTDHKADSAEFERWCAETYRSQAYLHTSATSGEWEAWQAGAAAMQARCAAQPAEPCMDTTLRNAARRSAKIVDRGRMVQPVEPVAWLKTMYSGTRPMLEVDHMTPPNPKSIPVYAPTPAPAAVPIEPTPAMIASEAAALVKASRAALIRQQKRSRQPTAP